MRPVSVALAFAVCAACTRPVAPPPAPLAAASAVDAGDDVAVTQGPEIDLLYQTRAQVAVSSNVDNPKDFPEHLIDRRTDTAWNGKTGDLNGTITFRVPAAARVHRLGLVVGYARVGPKGDLFTQNHRITEIELSREGVVVGRFALDPEQRGLQYVSVPNAAAAGGIFVIRVTRTLPGTEARWKELVVSELVVLGSAPEAEQLDPAMPHVVVGAIDQTTAHVEASAYLAPFPAFDALCAAARKAQVDFAKRDHTFHPLTADGMAVREVSCSKRKVPGPLPNGLTGVDVVGLTEGLYWTSRYLLTSATGVLLTDPPFFVEAVGPGCMQEFDIESTLMPSAPDGVVRVHVVRKQVTWGRPGSYAVAGTDAFFCKTEGGHCEHALVAYSDHVSHEVNVGFSSAPQTWLWTRTAELAGDALRLGPCMNAKGESVACRGASASRLLTPLQ